MMKKLITISILVILALGAMAQKGKVGIRKSGGNGAMHYKSNDNMQSNFTPTLAAYPLKPYATCQDLRRGNEFQWNTISWQSEDVDDGTQATVAYTVTNPASNIATGWDSWRYNRMTVNYTTAGPDTMRIDEPLYFDTSGQLPGEIFVVDIYNSRTVDADTLLIHFDSLFRTYDGQLLTEWKCPPRGRIWMAFRAHVTVEGYSWVEVDDILGSYGHSQGGGGGGGFTDVQTVGSYTGLKKISTSVVGFDPAGQTPTIPGGGIAAGDLFAMGDVSSGSAMFVPFSQVVDQMRDSIPVPILTAAEGITKNSDQFRLGGSYFLSHPSEFTAARKLNWGNFKSYIGTDNADSLKYVVFDIPNKRLGLGRTSPWAKMNIMGDGNTSATFALGVGNSDTTFFLLRNDGAVFFKNLTNSNVFASIPVTGNLSGFWGLNGAAAATSMAIGNNAATSATGSFAAGMGASVQSGRTNGHAYGYCTNLTSGIENSLFGSGLAFTAGSFLLNQESYTSGYAGYSIRPQMKLTGASTNSTNAWTAAANVVTFAGAHGLAAGENFYLVNGSTIAGAIVKSVTSTTVIQVLETPTILSGTGIRQFGTAFPIRFTAGTGGVGERPFAGMDKRGNWVFGGGLYNNSIPSTPYGRFDLRKDTTTMEAWGAKGVGFNSNAAVYIDQSTAASGTAAIAAINAFGIPTVSARNTSVTITSVPNVYIEGPAVAGTNVTIINAPSLHVDAGVTKLDGPLHDNTNSAGTSGQFAMSAGAGSPWAWTTVRYDTQKNSAASGVTTTLVDDGRSLTLWVVVDSVVGTSTIIQIPNPVAGLSKVEVIVTFQGFASGATALITTPGGTNVVADRQNFPSSPYRASITVDETKVGSEYHFKLNTANTIWLQGS